MLTHNFLHKKCEQKKSSKVSSGKIWICLRSEQLCFIRNFKFCIVVLCLVNWCLFQSFARRRWTDWILMHWTLLERWVSFTLTLWTGEIADTGLSPQRYIIINHSIHFGGVSVQKAKVLSVNIITNRLIGKTRSLATKLLSSAGDKVTLLQAPLRPPPWMFSPTQSVHPPIRHRKPVFALDGLMASLDNTWERVEEPALAHGHTALSTEREIVKKSELLHSRNKKVCCCCCWVNRYNCGHCNSGFFWLFRSWYLQHRLNWETWMMRLLGFFFLPIF